MKDGQTIYLWEKCQNLADDLGMTLKTNSETLLLQQGDKYLYVAETLAGVLGYLEGVTEERKAKRKGRKGHDFDPV